MVRTDVRIEPAAEEDEPAWFGTRRLVRWVAVLTLGVLTVLAIWQEPLYARL